MSALYLKDELVLQIKDVDGKPSELAKVVNPELLPLCLKDECTTETLMGWLSKRAIPDNREGIKEVDRTFGKEWRLANVHSLSLTDHYWILKRDEKKWSQANFFTNLYEDDIGNMFFAPWNVKKTKNFKETPDFTCGGVLKKRWKQDKRSADRQSYLLKAGSVVARQEPLNEVLVSVFCEKLGKIPCVKYELAVEGVIMCSKCANFVTVNTDFVPARDVYSHEKRKKGDTVLTHLLKMCDYYDIPNVEEFLKWVIFIDKHTGNEDRNLGNIGFLRDIKTLKFLGPAPLFDSGNAYFDPKFNKNKPTSKCFKEDEALIYSSLKKEVGSSVLTDKTYEGIVYKYPEISDKQKEKLVKVISTKNDIILGNIKEVDIDI